MFHRFFRALNSGLPIRAALVGGLAVLALSGLSGCALFQEDTDPTKGWSANKLYTTAKESLEEGNYEQAVNLCPTGTD
jgi:outer membrane protein assembly factor BamD